MLKVYGRANSINVRKVLWMLDEVGEPWTRDDWGRGFRPTSEPEFQRLNPVGVVPVIDDDGFMLRESNTIVRYLANKHRRTDLYPAESQRRATCEAWMDWASTDGYAGLRPVFHGLHLKNPAFGAKEIDAGIADWSKQMTVLNGQLSTGPVSAGPVSAGHATAGQAFVAGPPFTVADIPVGLLVNRWFSIDFKRPDLAAVAAYYERLGARPAFMTHGRNGTA